MQSQASKLASKQAGLAGRMRIRVEADRWGDRVLIGMHVMRTRAGGRMGGEGEAGRRKRIIERGDIIGNERGIYGKIS